MTLSDAELTAAREVLDVLRQEKYKNKMYLFLLPLNLVEVPGYFDIVPHKRILDMQTITSNLETYSSLTEFWGDLQGVFENAIAYHQDRESSWIAKMARDMLKVARREKQKRDGGMAPAEVRSMEVAEKKKKTFSVKLKLPSRQNATVPQQLAPPPPNDSDSVMTAAAAAIDVPAPTLSAASVKSENNRPVKAKPTQPKLKLKLSLGNKLKKEPTPSGQAPTTSQSTATTLAPAKLHSVASAKASSAEPTKAAPAKPKLSLKVGGAGSNSRGKELPKGVTAAAAAVPVPTSTAIAQPPAKKQKKVKAATSSSLVPAARSLKNSGLFPSAQATKVLAGLRRRENKWIHWFLQPALTDKNIAADYKRMIKHPSDISTMTTKIEKGSYTSVAAMVLDLRRIFGNCLIYNTSIKESLRPIAVQMMQTSEDLLKVFFVDYPGSYPPLLYCWKLCIGVLDTLYNLTNPNDGLATALYFQHPVSFYCNGQFPPDYSESVKTPMDFGTVTAKLMEAKYASVEEFCSDCQLVLTNCDTYYRGRPEGVIFVEQASRLKELLAQQVEQLLRYVKSSRGATDHARANAPVILPKPPVSLLASILQGMREITYTDKATKISEPLMGPFEKPVSLSTFPDYSQFVTEPMDLSLVERKVKAGSYSTPEDFEYDVTLMFRNCERYNASRGGDHLVVMSKQGAKQFRKLFYTTMKALEDPSSIVLVKEDERQDGPANQTVSTIMSSPASGASKLDSNRGKAAPRISISAAQLSAAAARAKLPSQAQKKSSGQPIKPDQPVPLHIAIARIKEAFPLRRQSKSLQPWEADCARFFKELMRHPWISATRPTYIFHVPVSTLYPDIREAYAAKIRKPMDLTTIECTLLAGNRYATPEDFVSDVALVFANSVRFNRDGKDVGDTLSSAYYDASIHLLRFSRWLSLELLAQYVEESGHVDEESAGGLPPFSWRLTSANKQRAREEMEKLVFCEPIDKSLEGDRYTWQEAECEKLLKSLRHQSDLRYMTFFIQPNYPADYAAYIPKQMDWEKVNRILKKRHYDKFGDIIGDLRLIFTNALKYNGRLKGTDTVSGRAYEAATIMSTKLEAAINKLLVTVSDRLERERIDHANAEREMEAHERAQEAQFFALWKKDADAATADGSNAQAPPSQSQAPDFASHKIRVIRHGTQRRESMDFEKPNFDDDDGGKHESSHFEVVKFQKALFEKTRQEQIRMRQRTAAIGGMVFARMLQRDLAKEWEETEHEKTRANNEPHKMAEAVADQEGGNRERGASEVLKELEREGRERLQITLNGLVKPKKKRKLPALSLE